jgi:hypothetical protein
MRGFLPPQEGRTMELRFGRWSLLWAFLFCSSACVNSQQLWSGILAPSRAVNWSNAGVSGGIPSASWAQCVTTACKTVTTGPASSITIAQINAAITSAPASTYVYLPAGTYSLTSGLLVNSQNNVEIRGAGANQTILNFTGSNSCQGAYAVICFQSTDVNWKDQPSNGPVNWTAGYSQGTTSITLASVPNLKVGNPIILDQEDDACASGCPGTTDTGTVFVCSDNTIALPCSLQDNAGGAQRLHRNQEQIVTVTSISGTGPYTVGISPGIYMSNWSAAKAPQAWWATSPIENVGVQNLSINMTNAGYTPGNGVGVEFFNALNGWVQGIAGIDGSRAMVQSQYSARLTVRNSYFFLTQNSTSTSYGFECYTGGDHLVENNIFQAVSGPLTINGSCSGTVLGYNYAVNDYYTGSAGYINAMSNVHTAGTDSILYEGNVGAQVYGDVFHGTHNLVTIFRNYLIGNQPACWQSGSTYAAAVWAACNNDQESLPLYAYTRFFNVVGNVLGQSGIQTIYSGVNSNLSIYNLGYANGLAAGNDPLVTSTLLRWGNYDTVNAAVRWESSEVPSAMTGVLATYNNPVPSSQTLPASFYYASTPSWWPSGKPWPLMGPDVTGGNISGLAGHAYTNPAEDCFLNVMNGPANGTGPVLSFNASSCYGTAAATPPAPTGVTGSVVTN